MPVKADLYLMLVRGSKKAVGMSPMMRSKRPFRF